jgi:hypothetical protein
MTTDSERGCLLCSNQQIAGQTRWLDTLGRCELKLPVGAAASPYWHLPASFSFVYCSFSSSSILPLSVATILFPIDRLRRVSKIGQKADERGNILP